MVIATFDDDNLFCAEIGILRISPTIFINISVSTRTQKARWKENGSRILVCTMNCLFYARRRMVRLTVSGNINQLKTQGSMVEHKGKIGDILIILLSFFQIKKYIPTHISVRRSFSFHGSWLWHSLPRFTRKEYRFHVFKRLLRHPFDSTRYFVQISGE